jgi:hypothetical protein
MPFTRNLAQVSEGVQIEYLDTGKPTVENYETIVYIPGAAHTASMPIFELH